MIETITDANTRRGEDFFSVFVLDFFYRSMNTDKHIIENNTFFENLGVIPSGFVYLLPDFTDGNMYMK